jgi:hypothetical protein
MNNYNDFLKDYVELWPSFCWHLDKTPKQITDRVLFKKEFTYERWKEGYHTYYNNTTFIHTLDSITTKKTVRISYNIYRFVPFNIKYEII